MRIGLAVLALAPATILMGATLPTLTRHLARNAELSSAFSRLYAANTIGAIVGTAVAGFVLIELLGLSGALAVGAGVLGRGRAGRLVAAAVVERVGRPVRGRRRSRASSAIRRAPRLALTVAFISGLTSLGYQVTWTRLLASGTGNTTYVFTMILGDVPDRPGDRAPALRSFGRGSAIRSACWPGARSLAAALATGRPRRWSSSAPQTSRHPATQSPRSGALLASSLLSSCR